VVFYISIDLLFLYVNLCKKMYMKKVYIVTPENLQEILKSLKEALETQTLIFERRIYTESSIQANEWLHLYPTNNFVPDPENEDECLMSISSEKRLTSDSINIEEDDDKNQFIAIRDFPTKTGYLINIGDKVTIVDNKIFTKKTDMGPNPYFDLLSW
jgi:mitochondrial fission protein ELM1